MDFGYKFYLWTSGSDLSLKVKLRFQTYGISPYQIHGHYEKSCGETAAAYLVRYIALGILHTYCGQFARKVSAICKSHIW